MRFIKELKALGLKDKEAAVYVACLELGPSPAQQIARKSHVVRATTYVILEELMKMGLVTEYKEGKKTLFSAEPPHQLMRLLEKEKETINEKQHDLELLLPELQMVIKAADHPSVKYFEGVEGLRAIRREMMMYSQAGDLWLNFTPLDHIHAALSDSDQLSYYNQTTAKGIKNRTIFTTKSDALKKKRFAEYKPGVVDQRFVPPHMFPSKSGMTIFRDRVAIGSFTGKIGGVIIESEQMTDMMRCLFELAWIGAENIDKSES